MIRCLSVLTAVLAVAPLLACGGVVPVDVPIPEIPRVETHTMKLCAHLAQANEAPCSPAEANEAVSFAGLEVRIVSAEPVRGSSSASYEERQAMKASGGEAIAVVVEVTNPGVVKVEHDFGVSLYTSDGELRFGSPGAAGAYASHNRLATAFTFGGLGPGKTKRVAHVFAAPASELGQGTLYFQKVEYKPDPKDPRGRRRNFVVDQALIALPGPAVD
ncbi:MAG: hypothetical protein R3F61_05115 [Myxococcota bacterium]